MFVVHPAYIVLKINILLSNVECNHPCTYVKYTKKNIAKMSLAKFLMYFSQSHFRVYMFTPLLKHILIFI